MTHNPASELTCLLQAYDPRLTTDATVHQRLLELVYDELRATARGLMARERGEHTLQPTGLVHEAWLRLFGGQVTGWKDRAHFHGIAARCMRQVLVDHARAHNAEKRGGGLHQVTLEENLLAADSATIQLLDLDRVLAQLAELDQRAAQVAEMRIFGALTLDEIAHNLNVSRRTCDGDWQMARLWLTRELGDQ